jgi:hypothetical protein
VVSSLYQYVLIIDTDNLVFVAVGCINSSSAIKGVYIAELHTNDTYDFSLRFGYFGTTPHKP